MVESCTFITLNLITLKKTNEKQKLGRVLTAEEIVPMISSHNTRHISNLKTACILKKDKIV